MLWLFPLRPNKVIPRVHAFILHKLSELLFLSFWPPHASLDYLSNQGVVVSLPHIKPILLPNRRLCLIVFLVYSLVEFLKDLSIWLVEELATPKLLIVYLTIDSGNLYLEVLHQLNDLVFLQLYFLLYDCKSELIHLFYHFVDSRIAQMS